MSGQRVICCPICGREIGVKPHEPGREWTSQQRWLVAKLDRVGISRKVTARLIGVSVGSVAEQVRRGKYGAR